MRADEFNPEYENPNDDLIQQREKTNSRKPTITLRLLHKLKKMRQAKDIENLARNDFMQIIYGSPEEGSEEGGLGGL